MTAYLVRRLLYAIPILIGVNLLTFALFFVVNTPDGISTKASFNSRRNGVDRATIAKREPTRSSVTRVSWAMFSETPTSCR